MSQQQISDRLQKLVQVFEKLGLPVVQDFHNLGGWGTKGKHSGLIFSADSEPQGQVNMGTVPNDPSVRVGLWFAEYPVPHTRGGHPYSISWWRLGDEPLPDYGYQIIKGNLSKAKWRPIDLDPELERVLRSAINNKTCVISAFEVFEPGRSENHIGTIFVVRNAKGGIFFTRGKILLTFGNSWMPGDQKENTEYHVVFWKTQ